jgi:hypothetical protein
MSAPMPNAPPCIGIARLRVRRSPKGLPRCYDGTAHRGDAATTGMSRSDEQATRAGGL